MQMMKREVWLKEVGKLKKNLNYCFVYSIHVYNI